MTLTEKKEKTPIDVSFSFTVPYTETPILVWMRKVTVVNRANVGSNQSEREKDNRGIVLEGHVSH